MFIVIKDFPGNAPLVRVYSDYEEAEKDFNETHLSDYIPNVHLAEFDPEQNDTTVMKTRSFVDSEEILWRNPLA